MLQCVYTRLAEPTSLLFLSIITYPGSFRSFRFFSIPATCHSTATAHPEGIFHLRQRQPCCPRHHPRRQLLQKRARSGQAPLRRHHFFRGFPSTGAGSCLVCLCHWQQGVFRTEDQAGLWFDQADILFLKTARVEFGFVSTKRSMAGDRSSLQPWRRIKANYGANLSFASKSKHPRPTSGGRG